MGKLKFQTTGSERSAIGLHIMSSLRLVSLMSIFMQSAPDSIDNIHMDSVEVVVHDFNTVFRSLSFISVPFLFPLYQSLLSLPYIIGEGLLLLSDLFIQ